MGYSLTSILCMEKWVLHDPTLRDDVCNPFKRNLYSVKLQRRINLYREKLLPVHRYTRQLSRIGQRRNWCEINAEFLKHWNQRKNYLVNLIDADKFEGLEKDASASIEVERFEGPEKNEIASIEAERFEGPEKDEITFIEAERELLRDSSPGIFANDTPKPVHCQKPVTGVTLDDTLSSASPYSSDEDSTPLSSLPETRTRCEASVGGDSGGDDSKIAEVEQFFAKLPAKLQLARSPGSDIKSPALKKPRYSQQVLDKTKAEVHKLLMMPLHEAVLPVNFSALMASLPIYAASPHLSAEKVHALKELKVNLQPLFFDFHTAKKQQEECNSKDAEKVILIDELTKRQELYNDIKHRLNEIDTSMNSIRSQISDLKASLEEATKKRRGILEEGLDMKNICSAKLAALEELEAEFIDLKKELADYQISQAEVSWADCKQKLVGLGL